jgi:serine/threonine protein kinase/tetratricopeptide (TPR) repeat protein
MENEEIKRRLGKLPADDRAAADSIEATVWATSDFTDLASSPTPNSAFGENASDEKSASESVMVGRQFGAYKITAEVGRGGMGAVYAAERVDGSFYRKVAVKLIKRGMDTDFILKRFRQERQILATLNHPHIARLLDGGTTENGLPYFVMEFIQGKPLYKYADEKKLNIKERLMLFREVCQAIDFAHQNQVIHRDIKPPNILITDEGVPKVLDFGIAKVLNPEFNLDTLDPTATAMRLMTPEYASPEQVSGKIITPASDIYSLGVLLYELLTGHRPYRFHSRAPHEIARVICEEEPDRPSTKITREDNLLPTGSSEATTVGEVCLFRGANNITDLQKELSGDLEKIILKSLRKSAGDRYQTAAALAEDITRYLEGKSVTAETPFPSLARTVLSKKYNQKSLAILPLRILTRTSNGGTDEEFLSIGLADAMITRLSAIRSLIVRPTRAVLRFGDVEDFFSVGRELGVDFVLSGTIRRAGARIRISAQLIDIEKDSVRWAQSFDENMTDVLDIEDSVAEKVAKLIIPQLSGQDQQKLSRRGTNNPQAFESYVRGRYHFGKRTLKDLKMAISLFEQSIAADQNFALAYTGLADCWALLNWYQEPQPPDAWNKARAAAEKAVALDDNLAEAHASLGFIKFHFERNYHSSEEEFRRAVNLKPNYATAHQWYAFLLSARARHNEAIAVMQRAEELEPGSAVITNAVANALFLARLYDESIAQAQRSLEIDPDSVGAHVILRWNYEMKGEADKALMIYEKEVFRAGDTPTSRAKQAHVFAAIGKKNEALEILNKLIKTNQIEQITPYEIAIIYALMDDKKKSFEWLRKAKNKYAVGFSFVKVDPLLDNLRNDRVFEDLIKTIM